MSTLPIISLSAYNITHIVIDRSSLKLYNPFLVSSPKFGESRFLSYFVNREQIDNINSKITFLTNSKTRNDKVRVLNNYYSNKSKKLKFYNKKSKVSYKLFRYEIDENFDKLSNYEQSLKFQFIQTKLTSSFILYELIYNHFLR